MRENTAGGALTGGVVTLQCDFPESLSCWKEMGEKAGFATVEGAVTSKFDLARVLVYRV